MSSTNLSYCFNGSNLKQLPPMKNMKPSRIGGFLNECFYLTTIPDDYADTWDFTTLNKCYNPENGGCMVSCCSLRKAPKFLKYLYNLYNSTSYNPYRGLLNYAFNIDEIIGYPCPPVNFTSNFFSYLHD